MRALRVHPDADSEHPRGDAVRAALGEVAIGGDFAQFGVYRGKTARIIEKLMEGDRKLHLFDSFEGLPEDWMKRKPAGTFKIEQDEIPVFSSPRVVMHKGWFKDTVPVWARETATPLAFLHLDADLYSSTVDALFNADHLIPKGSILLFDEYVSGGDDQEHRALVDWAAKFNRQYELLWRSSGVQVCVRVN